MRFLGAQNEGRGDVQEYFLICQVILLGRQVRQSELYRSHDNLYEI